MTQASVDDLHSSEQIGSPCVACRLPLPIEPAPINEQGEYWHCEKCGTRHHGKLLKDAPLEIAKNVLPGEKKQVAPAKKPKASGSKSVAKETLPAREPVVCTHETRLSRVLDKAIDDSNSLSVETKGPAFKDRVKFHGATRYDTALENKFHKQYDHSCNQVDELMVALEQDNSLDVKATSSITRESLAQAAEDMDLFVKLGINPSSREYSGKHNYHVAMLATSIATNMNWDEQTISEVGIGCLLHDIGMIRVSQDLLKKERVLSQSEFIDITRHPIDTFDLIERNLHEVPTISKMVAYQIHERCDGSGYPRNRKATGIHEAARIAAVADVYIALISPRPHRPPMMPHFAVKHLLYGVRDGKFDSDAVRSLLHTVSLFPIGSYLELKDGRVGQVIRVRPEAYAKPLVEAWHPDRLDESPQLVDLAQHASSEVLRPLSSLN